jgi:hypothetical protein
MALGLGDPREYGRNADGAALIACFKGGIVAFLLPAADPS